MRFFIGQLNFILGKDKFRWKIIYLFKFFIDFVEFIVKPLVDSEFSLGYFCRLTDFVLGRTKICLSFLKNASKYCSFYL